MPDTPTNPLRAAIQGGSPFLVVNGGGFAPTLIRALARQGAACLFIDCEKVILPDIQIRALAIAAQTAGMSSVVRSPDPDPARLRAYTACGIDGLVVPQVESAAVCEAMAQTARQSLETDGRDLVLIAQIESIEGQARTQEIAGHARIDLILIGPNDLAESMGHPGEVAHPEVSAAVRAIAGEVAGLGKPFGLPVSAASIADWVGRDATFLYTHVDQFIASGLGELRALADGF